MLFRSQSLRENISRGKFREDLYQRLKGVTLLIPPLRERREELPGLIAAELKAAARAAGKKITAIHPDAMDRLLAHEWRGNLRELNHLMRTVALFCEGKTVLPDHVVFDTEPVRIVAATTTPAPAPGTDGGAHGEDGHSLSAAAHRHIRAVYEQANCNQRRTARLLGISRAKLRRHLAGMGFK